MSVLRKIGRSQEGVGAVEFAFAAPVLLAFIIGIAQLGILFFANSGLKAAVGEGARYATIFPRPTVDQIKARITSRRFGLDPTYVSELTVVASEVGKRNVVDIRMTYTAPIDFIFFKTPPVTLEEKRRAYVHAAPPAA